MEDDPIVFLHVGAPKTGSTFLQKNVFPYWPNMKYKNEILDILKYKLTKNFEDLIYYNPKIDEYIKNIISKKNDPYTVSEEIFKKFVHMGEKV